ncbi:MAG: formyltransferase family protein [Nanoarchaeota archaeon]
MTNKKLIIFCAYRDWAIEIFNNVRSGTKGIDFKIFTSPGEFDAEAAKLNPDLVFFVGWSWIIPENVVSNLKCICLHPSPLPKYRGGSPIQHQIINGEEKSAVTLFLMDQFVDKGPIIWQEEFPLDGELYDIFCRIVEQGSKGIMETIGKYLKTGKIEGTSQDMTRATYYKRRTPEESEIKISDFQEYTAKQLYDKIRALQSPYPNAFIVCKDGRKLIITKARIEE